MRTALALWIRTCRRVEQQKAIGDAICALCVSAAVLVLLTNIVIATLHGKLVSR